MRIRFQSDGGVGYFPGLDEPVIVDTARLEREAGARLEKLVGAAEFFSRPEAVGVPAPGAADLRRYTIAIEDGGHSRTVEVMDPVEDTALRALIDALREAGKAARDH